MPAVKGSSATVEHTETFETSSTLTSASLATVDPAGGTGSPAVTPTPAFGVAALEHLLNATVSFGVAGVWLLTWAPVAGPQTLQRPEEYLCSRYDVVAELRTLLGHSEKTLSGALADEALCFLHRRLYALWGSYIPAYNTAPAFDARAIDDFLLYTAAAWLKPVAPHGTPEGEVTQVTTNDDTVKFTAPRAGGGLNANDTFLGAALDALRRISAFNDWYTKSVTDAGLFRRSGPRRRARTKLGLGDDANPLYGLWSDDRARWDFERGIFKQ